MQVAPPATAMPAPTHHKPVPELPALGTISFARPDGASSSFEVRPYLHEPGDWATRFDTVAGALDAASGESAYWSGLVTFGIVQAADGAFLIRPMESENGNAFTLRPEEVGATAVTATATAAELVGLVSDRTWIDFRGDRTDVAPVPIERAPAGIAAQAV